MWRWLLASGAALALLGGVIASLYAITTAMPESSPEPAVTSEPPQPESTSGAADDDPPSDPPVEAAVAQRLEGEFARIADQYEAGSQFPPYSFPIDQGAVDDYRYNGYSPVRVPVASDGEKATITLRLDQLHFEYGEPITGMVGINGDGASGVSLDEVTLRDQTGDVLYRESLEAGAGEKRLSMSPGTSGVEAWPMELMLMVSGDFRGESADAVAPVRYHAAVGDITDVGSSRVEGAHLVIPVQVSIDSDGDYAIAGNLYSESGTPLVHVEHEARLATMDSTAQLRVHRQALEASGDAGPYRLGDLSLRQLPARPGDRTRFSPTDDERYDVEGAPFERYDQANYKDPMREARLEFLRNAAEEIEP